MVKRFTYLNKLDKLRDTEEIKIITGVRRSGKTHLLKEYMKKLNKEGIPEENIIYISFESNRYNHIKDGISLNKWVYEKTENVDGKVYLFFDEVHKVSNWEESINGYRVDYDADIYVTGSYGHRSGILLSIQ
ncbi:AAA family ATPase (plasmid) [Methanosphaera sp. ISO3-F5]|uniref:AAA family ATPase n=1 Tax=Methanosphaera sp. ISO3-F5 TaxID=1452353 RepID=UPI002B262446|nr:AAA family ATPase [Methanosphaera sp. ISO3-F5]WQH65391.1 AAA family ATPase [Methanosphaera sp. ISO3-F5]